VSFPPATDADRELLLELIEKHQPALGAELRQLTGWHPPRRFNSTILAIRQDGLVFCDMLEDRYMLPDSLPHKQYLARLHEREQVRRYIVEQLGGYSELPPGYTHLGLYRFLTATPEGVNRFLELHGEDINSYRKVFGKQALKLP